MASSEKIYLKRGRKTVQESKYISELTRYVRQNPEEKFKPAKDFGSLKRLWEKYCVEETNIIENNESTRTGTLADEIEKHEEQFGTLSDNEIGENSEEEILDENDEEITEPIDPFNKNNPNIRDYVSDSEFSNNGIKNSGNSFQTSFSEPTDFQTAFEIPSEEGSNNTNGQAASNKKQHEKPSDPVNPQWDDIKNKDRNASSKRFAKYIVETVCFLSEKGFVWYANKDINEAKLAEYELNKEMDLNLLLTMPDGQRRTVRHFFKQQCLAAEQLAKIDPEEKKDLIIALSAFLLEKGVAPSPTQELALIALKVFGAQAVTLFALKSSTNSVLEQLREIKKGQNDDAAFREEEAIRNEQEMRKKSEEEVALKNKTTQEGEFLQNNSGGGNLEPSEIINPQHELKE